MCEAVSEETLAKLSPNDASLKSGWDRRTNPSRKMKEPAMTPNEINKLSRDELLDTMRREGLEVVHSMFSTIHHRSPQRPDGFDEDDLDEIGEDLADADLATWRRQLIEHFAAKNGA
ncbi:MAG: hypothetical protein NW206_02070 [Hyphomonadaceae bacterium]|nr:hypothetical protein [Hyphomonadaceae bacterium]